MRVSIDTEFLEQLQKEAGGSIKSTQLTSEALALLKWAIEEVRQGKKIVSVDKEEHQKEITLPSLSMVKTLQQV